MKTEAQLQRTDEELYAVDDAIFTAHHYNRPKDGIEWKRYLEYFESKLVSELQFRIEGR